MALPEKVTGKGFAIRQDGTRVLYRCARCGDEAWWDFAKDRKYRGWPRMRRLALATNTAAFVMGWHSEAKGGGYIRCERCAAGWARP